MRRHAAAPRTAFISTLAILGAVALTLCGLLAAGTAAAATPQLKIGTPENPGYTTVEIGGEVNPEGDFVEWRFEVSKDGGASWEVPGGFGAEGTWGFLSGSGFESTGTQTLHKLKPGTSYLVRLFVTDYSEYQELHTPEPSPAFETEVLPDPTLAINPPTAITDSTAHFSGEIDPNQPGGNPEASDVKWHFQCSPECPGIGEDKTVLAEEGSTEVKVDASNLEPNTEYEVKLVGANAGGTFETASESFKTEAVAPSATTTPPLLLAGNVQLGGRVNPHNSATTYWVEYGTTTAYGTTVPVEPAVAGSDGAFHTVSISAAGLAPGLTYHVRVVAENAKGTTEGEDRVFTVPVQEDPDRSCPNESVRAEQHVDLPDCRAYELVSTEDGNFGDVVRVTGSADNGEKVGYMSLGGTESSASAFFTPASVSARTPDRWTVETAAPAAPEKTGGTVRLVSTIAFNQTFTEALVATTANLDPEDQNGSNADLYLVSLPSGSTTWINRPEAQYLPWTNQGGVVSFAGASRDLSRIYFQEQNATLIEGAPAGALYEWHGNQLSLASLNPGTSLPAGGALAVGPHGYSGYQDAGSIIPVSVLAHNGPHAVSDDGSAFIYESEEQLLLSSNAAVTEFTAPQAGFKTGHSTFIGADRSGETIYFGSTSMLNESGGPGGGIYRYEGENESLVQVTPSAGPDGLRVTDAIMSDNAQTIYFLANAAVAPGAEPGVPNLYIYADGKTQFVASVPGGGVLRRVSRDGRFLVMQSDTSIAGAPTDGHQTIYEYDRQGGLLSCASCRADGSPSSGEATVDDTGANAVQTLPTLSSPRNISDDGRVFFSTTDRLVSEDQNNVYDVYEFFNGKVSLLSSGSSNYESSVQDSSDDGSNIFIITRSSLVPADQDGGLGDLYDVRSGGGFTEPVVTEPGCITACQRRNGTPLAAEIGSRSVARVRSGRLAVSGKRSFVGSHGVLSVQVNGSGTIAVSGAQVRSVNRTAPRAGTYRLGIRLTRKAKHRLSPGNTVKVRVRTSFTLAGGGMVHKQVILSFRSKHGATRKGGSR